MKVKITVYKSTGKYYTEEVVENPIDIPLWRDEFMDFIVEKLPARIEEGYITVEDIGENINFHQCLYVTQDLMDNYSKRKANKPG